MNTFSVSVIIPVKNRAKDLSILLGALAQQSVGHECIVVDRGSTDGTLEVARRFGDWVIHGKSRTVGGLRNEVILASNAPVVALIDSDHEVPDERMDICAVSDGSSDRTDEIVLSYGDRVRLVRSPQRVGKAMCVNLGLQETASGIVVFTDANTEFVKDAVMRLVAPLADPSDGFVVGTQGYRTLRNAPAEKSE